MSGIYTELDDLITLRLQARNLHLFKNFAARSQLAGGTISPFKGRGVDFEEVRAYQPGDDIRTIDWRVTARRSQPHTKIFREERERPVLVVTDLGNNMFFGSRRCLKSVLACNVSALLCWAALNQGDRVGGLVFNELGHREIRPKRSRKSVLSLLNLMAESNQALPLDAVRPENSFSNMLTELRRIARPGTSIYIVSDFQGAIEDQALDNLYQLSRHTQLNALHCSDPLESQLPASGLYRVTDGNAKTDLFTGSRALRKQYRSDFKQAQDQLRSAYSKQGIPLIELSTAQDPLDQLQPYYSGHRSRRTGT